MLRRSRGGEMWACARPAVRTKQARHPDPMTARNAATERKKRLRESGGRGRGQSFELYHSPARAEPGQRSDRRACRLRAFCAMIRSGAVTTGPNSGIEIDCPGASGRPQSLNPVSGAPISFVGTAPLSFFRGTAGSGTGLRFSPSAEVDRVGEFVPQPLLADIPCRRQISRKSSTESTRQPASSSAFLFAARIVIPRQ
jgi:hypothetical protein